MWMTKRVICFGTICCLILWVIGILFLIDISLLQNNKATIFESITKKITWKRKPVLKSEDPIIQKRITAEKHQRIEQFLYEYDVLYNRSDTNHNSSNGKNNITNNNNNKSILSALSASSSSSRIIWQTWKTNWLSDIVEERWKVILERNPEYERRIMNDTEAEIFIREYYGTESNIYHAYRSVNPHGYGAVRADLWRYAILYAYGGIYIDSDAMLNENYPLRDWVQNVAVVTKEIAVWSDSWYKPCQKLYNQFDSEIMIPNRLVGDTMFAQFMLVFPRPSHPVMAEAMHVASTAILEYREDDEKIRKVQGAAKAICLTGPGAFSMAVQNVYETIIDKWYNNENISNDNNTMLNMENLENNNNNSESTTTSFEILEKECDMVIDGRDYNGKAIFKMMDFNENDNNKTYYQRQKADTPLKIIDWDNKNITMGNAATR